MPSKGGKKAPPAKAAPAKKPKKADPLFPSTPRNFRIGGDIRPKGRDLGRFVKWPRYIRLQRQRKILCQRLKVPPAINQFSKTFDKNNATELFKLMTKYRPETVAAKKERLRDAAEKKAGGADDKTKAPVMIKYGLKHVTYLIEQKKAKLVVIANDVNPIELVVCIPALCRKMDIPYCIVKNKARLGALVHKKNAAIACLTAVHKEDQHKMDSLGKNFRGLFNDDSQVQRKWGGGIMGLKTQAKLEKRQKAIEIENAKKAQY